MIFSLTASAPRSDISSRLQTVYPNNHYLVFDGPPSTWLIYAPAMTSFGVIERLGMNTGDDGRVLVTGVAGYNGFHRTDLWEWIKTRGQV